MPGSRETDRRLAILRRIEGLILDIDVVLFEGDRVGIKSFLVLSSLAPEFHLENDACLPDAVFESTRQFYDLWKQR